MTSMFLDHFNAIQAAERPDIRQLSDRVSVARIEHTCDDCGTEILVGDRIRRVVLVVDGDLSVEKTHDDDRICRNARHHRRFF